MPDSEFEPHPDQKPDDKPEMPKTTRAKYVWQRLWFQWVLGTLVFFLFLSFVLPPIYWLITKLSPVLTPVLLGLVLAYIFSPLSNWAQRRHNIQRPVTAGLILGAAVLALAIIVPILITSVVYQVSRLVDNAPQYTETVLNWLGSDSQDAQRRVNDFIASLDWTQLDTQAAQRALGVSAGVLFTGLGYLSYAAIFILVSAFCFFIFSWKLESLKEWFGAFIPKPYRDETHRILGLMDNTVSAIVRGRLIQSLVVMFVLSIGWWITGVPYWLLLGVLGGVLNLLPFAAVLSWPLAVLLTVVDKANGGTLAIVAAIVWPSVVYLIAQSLDGWVIEPLIQGKATGMDALTVLLVVLAGGALLGLLGVVLAVPIAACIKIVSQELLLPKLRAFAEDPPDLNRRGWD